MSEIWHFSPSLEHKVQLCISAARQDENKKWLKEFGHVKTEMFPTLSVGTNVLVDLCDFQHNPQCLLQDENRQPIQEVERQENIICTELDEENIDEFVEAIETEFDSNFLIFVEESSKYASRLPLLAKKLSVATIEKLCTHIYDRKDLNNQFIQQFFELFILTYIKREFNYNTLDILVRGNKNYPIEFRILLKMLVKDKEVPIKVLQDYVVTLNENERNTFIAGLAEIDLSEDEFVDNLFSIYTAYKDCTKSNTIQNYINAILQQYSSICVLDRNYGRLFLAYLQAQKCFKSPADYVQLEKLLEVHQSPFKRPCLSLLKELSASHETIASEDDDSD